MRPRRLRPSPLTRSAFAGFCFPPEVIVLASAGISASRSPTATSKNCSPNAGSKSTTPLSTAGRSTRPTSRLLAMALRLPRDRPFGHVIDVFVSPRRDATAARRFFQHAIDATKVTPVEVVTDKAAAYPVVLEEVLPAVWHHTEQYANNHIECDHGRLKAWLRPMRGLKQDRSARVVVAGHALVQNMRRGHDELAVEAPANRRVAVAFDDLAMAI